jgi:hypothetical protein
MDYPAKTNILCTSGKMSKERGMMKKRKSPDYRGFEGKVGHGSYSRFYPKAGLRGREKGEPKLPFDIQSRKSPATKVLIAET